MGHMFKGRNISGTMRYLIPLNNKFCIIQSGTEWYPINTQESGGRSAAS